MYFKLFSNCIPVKGYTHSVLYDLQMCTYNYIPNLVFEILKMSQLKSVDELKLFYNNEYDSGIDHYFNYFAEKGLGFYTNEPELFPDFDLSWDTPYEITNLIIDNSLEAVKQVVGLLEVDDLTIILDKIDDATISSLSAISSFISYQSLQLFILYDKLVPQKIHKLLREVNRISSIVVFKAPIDEKESYNESTIVYIRNEFCLNGQCNIHPNYFSCNIPHFTEAQHFNTYFNKKLYISPNGDLKNTYNSAWIGNIKQINTIKKIYDLMRQPDFLKLSTITKDNIQVCKDCEFRYMCTDDRIPVQEQNGEWTHLIPCNYDPYTGEWR